MIESHLVWYFHLILFVFVLVLSISLWSDVPANKTKLTDAVFRPQYIIHHLILELHLQGQHHQTRYATSKTHTLITKDESICFSVGAYNHMTWIFHFIFKKTLILHCQNWLFFVCFYCFYGNSFRRLVKQTDKWNDL